MDLKTNHIMAFQRRGNMRYTIAAAALFSAFGAAAHAEILAGGSIYGGTSQTDAVCYVFNAGGTAVDLGKPEIRTQNGALKTLNTNSCPATLGARRGCAWAAPIASNLAHECAISV